ncbi:MAG: hypothetical protein ABR545_04360 [Cyclonatronaceae bacterium]
MHSFRKYCAALLFFAPLLLVMIIQLTTVTEGLAAIPVEQSQNDCNQKTFSELMEETSKEDDIHIRCTPFLYQSNKFRSGTILSTSRIRILIQVPYPPPDLV